MLIAWSMQDIVDTSCDDRAGWKALETATCSAELSRVCGEVASLYTLPTLPKRQRQREGYNDQQKKV